MIRNKNAFWLVCLFFTLFVFFLAGVLIYNGFFGKKEVVSNNKYVDINGNVINTDYTEIEKNILDISSLDEDMNAYLGSCKKINNLEDFFENPDYCEMKIISSTSVSDILKKLKDASSIEKLFYDNYNRKNMYIISNMNSRETMFVAFTSDDNRILYIEMNNEFFAYHFNNDMNKYLLSIK